MSDLRLTFELDQERVTEVIARMAERARDLRPAWSEILEDFKAGVRAQFRGQGGVLSERWRPLSASYARYKARRFPGRRILERSGRLERAATGASSEFELTMRPLLLRFRITTPYALYQHRRRPIARFTPAQVARWARMVREQLEETAAA